MSTEILKKRISDFVIGVPESVELFAKTKEGGNVRVPYDVQQSIGTSTTSVISQAAITSELQKRDNAIEGVIAQTIGNINPLNQTISVLVTDRTATIGVNVSSLVAEDSGLKVADNSIGVAIDQSEGNRLSLTSAGELRVESENYWAEI